MNEINSPKMNDSNLYSENEDKHSDEFFTLDKIEDQVVPDLELLDKIESLDLKIKKELPRKNESLSTSSDESYILVDEDGTCKDIKMAKYIEKKISQIEETISSHPVDLERLKELAVSKEGFIKDDLRKKAWPLLMHMDRKKPPTDSPELEELEKHQYYNQVVMDVNRSLKRFPPGIEEDHRYVLMDQLTYLIVRVLHGHPNLHYYQGYHDVAITILLVMGEDKAYSLVERLSLTHLYEFMKPTMDRTVYYLTYVYPILQRARPPLHHYIVKSEVGTVFCLPWLITWYAHTLPNYKDVVRLYDFFLASPYLMPMYLAAAIIIKKEEEIMSSDCDMAVQHFILSKVPETLYLEEIIVHASHLYMIYPPDDMQEEVQQIIKKKEEEEKEIKRQLARNRHPQTTLLAILNYLPWHYRLKAYAKTALKIFAITVVATAATGIYSYYTKSPLLSAYLPWGRS